MFTEINPCPNGLQYLFLEFMRGAHVFSVRKEKIECYSEYLDRIVTVDFYLPRGFDKSSDYSLLLINDGQDLESMDFDLLLAEMQDSLRPLVCVGIHCSADRKMEYGITGYPDFKGRGARAGLYEDFIIRELIPDAEKKYTLSGFRKKAFAGFSLGGLSAMSIAWNHPQLFSTAGVFSGSFWWRSVDQEDSEYDDQKHRIMHQVVRGGPCRPGLRFFFQCGNLDEKKDRNKNGIIDSIDDTLDLIAELKQLGYPDTAIVYMEIPDGRHDVPTWARAFPFFLKWGWGR